MYEYFVLLGIWVTSDFTKPFLWGHFCTLRLWYCLQFAMFACKLFCYVAHDRVCWLCILECCTFLFVRSFVRSLTRSLVHSFIHSFTHSFIHSFTRSLVHSFIHSFIHSFFLSFFLSFFPSFLYVMLTITYI